MKETPKKSRSGTSQTRAQRKARGLAELQIWIRVETLARLDELCEATGETRPQRIAGLIDAARKRLK